MALQWSWWALPGLVSGVLSLGMAALVWRTAPDRRVNRVLATLLAVEGIGVGVQTGVQYLMTTADAALLAQRAAAVLVPLIIAAYLLFIATLDAPLARWLRLRTVRAGIIGLTAAASAWVILRPGTFAPEALPTQLGFYQSTIALPMQAIYGLLAIVSVYGLVVAVSVVRRASHGSAARTKALAYVWAFGIRDAAFIFFGLVLNTYLKVRHPALTDADTAAYFFPLPLFTIAFVLTMGYGILRTHLFDIDLKIKSGISRSTVAAIGIAVVLIAAKVFESYVSRELGFIAGGVAAGMVLFLAPRLNRLGDKVANTALPNVQPTSSYVAFKKLEVYRAAVEAALEDDGVIDHKERIMLDRLRAKLALTDVDCQAVEAELAPSSPTSGSAPSTS